MQAEKTDIELQVDGMHCANCALGVHKQLEKRGGSKINVNFSTGDVSFQLSETNALPQIIRSIEDLGYSVTKAGDTTAEKAGFSVEWKFYVSLAFSIPLFLHMFLPFHFLHNPYVQLGLCLPVIFIGLMHFGKSAIGSIKSGVPNMDVLILIGFSSAFIYSLTGLIMNLGADFLFFETSSTIITLVLLGNLIEKRSVQKTTTALDELNKLRKLKVKLIQNGKIIEVEQHDIKQGDVVIVANGEYIPVDGFVLDGSAAVNESMINGESLPVDKEKNDSVISGTIIMNGSLQITAMKVGKQTTLSSIIELVKNAQLNKPSIQKLGDRVSAIFVPVVIGISLLTFLISYFAVGISLQSSLMSSIAVLVISCPCAMGLATPTAVMVGISRAARNGILLKGGDTLEQLAGIKTIIFDKTGTLTTGNYKVEEFKTEKITADEAKSIIYEMEKYSNHPVAKSLVSIFKDFSGKAQLVDVKELKGMGMSAKDQKGNEYRFGSWRNTGLKAEDPEYSLHLSINNEVVASLSIRDEIRKEAHELIRFLIGEGITPVMLSGDSEKPCRKAAEELGIKLIYFSQLPEQKIEMVKEFAKKGKTAMVGDGINDAPALTQAQIGISLAEASSIAQQSANVVLLKNDLSYIKYSLLIGKHSLLTIKQNLFWAFAYNIVAIPIAAFGLLNPMVAALSMAFSDVIVIGNSIRLKTKKLN